jgi:hypothetical protein
MNEPPSERSPKMAGLVERSSLGTNGAKQMRSRTPEAVTHHIASKIVDRTNKNLRESSASGPYKPS